MAADGADDLEKAEISSDDMKGEAETNEEAKEDDSEEEKEDENESKGKEDEKDTKTEEEGKVKQKRKRRPTVPDPFEERGLPFEVQHMLARAIEAEGGIALFSKFGCVRALCDSNVIFGACGSKRREKVRNKIGYWKNIPPDRYKKILRKLCQPPQLQPPPKRSRSLANAYMPGISQPGQQQQQQSAANMTRQALFLQATAQQAQAMHAQQTQARGQAGAQQFPMHIPQLYQGGASAAPSAPPPATKRKLSIDADIDYETITVDTKNPERNKGFEIYEISDIEKDGMLVNAFEITTSGDLRDFLADSYKAEFVGEREVLVSMPSVSYSTLHDHEEFSKKAKSGGLHCPCTHDAHESTRKRILRDPTRQKRHILFVFPDTVELSNKVFSPESTNKEIEFELIPITVKVNFNGKDLPMTITRISWKLSIVEKQQRAVKAKETEAQSKGAAKLAHLFSM